ncbi:STAS domain-containing protein [Pseudomonas akapageensis]|uniref:STAS domain-containing protein n=1 Tax=Pseudomonas akapageensis TaxID=2609961 RepID=UPI0014095BE5|nr:STAS domain-containing protein [Pseudomonas akapageensis]
MAVIVQREEDASHCLGITGELNIYSAATVLQELLQALEAHRQLEIGLAGVDDFDTAGVQLLLMLKREAARQDKPLTFVQHSAAVREVLDLLNLVAELGDPMVIPLEDGECLS